MASHIFVKDISPESLAARDGNIQEGDVVLKVRTRDMMGLVIIDDDLEWECHRFKSWDGHSKKWVLNCDTEQKYTKHTTSHEAIFWACIH